MNVWVFSIIIFWFGYAWGCANDYDFPAAPFFVTFMTILFLALKGLGLF